MVRVEASCSNGGGKGRGCHAMGGGMGEGEGCYATKVRLFDVP